MASRELVFRLAFFWRISPFEIEGRTLEDVQDLVHYSELFVKEENERWQGNRRM